MDHSKHSLYLDTQAAIARGESLSAVREKVLGKNGSFKVLLRNLATIAPEKRQKAHDELEALRISLQALLEHTDAATENVDTFDTSLPPLPRRRGSLHPISAMIEEMVGIFQDLSFEVVEGDELVSTTDNFDNLNIDIHHPARDGHDSFYITEDTVLRTQTTAVQVRELQRRQKLGLLPCRVVVPGRTYRREADATHSPMFHQLDAIVIDQNATFAELKGVLLYLTRRLYGTSVETRFRPHHFPFTEPSAEMDIRLPGAPASSRLSRWLELGGCGMIHPEVLHRAGISSKTHRGWAFGLGIERPTMMRHGITDLRQLFGADSTFLSQSRYI